MTQQKQGKCEYCNGWRFVLVTREQRIEGTDQYYTETVYVPCKECKDDEKDTTSVAAAG